MVMDEGSTASGLFHTDSYNHCVRVAKTVCENLWDNIRQQMENIISWPGALTFSMTAQDPNGETSLT